MLGSAGDVIGGNFKVPDRMAGAMEEGRAVGASSCGQPFIPARNQGSALPIRVSQSGRQGSNEARGSEFDSRSGAFFLQSQVQGRAHFFLEQNHSVKRRHKKIKFFFNLVKVINT